MAEVDEPYRAPTAQQRPAPLGPLTRWVFAIVAVSMLLAVLAGVGLMIGAFFHKNEFGVEDQGWVAWMVIAAPWWPVQLGAGAVASFGAMFGVQALIKKGILPSRTPVAVVAGTSCNACTKHV